MEFLSSSVKHRLQLSQDGNWLQGSYQATFQTMSAEGYIDGDLVRIRCTHRQPGNQLVYILIGSIRDGRISGDVHLGEYRTAKFSAEQQARPSQKRRFLVPGGPPLAT